MLSQLLDEGQIQPSSDAYDDAPLTMATCGLSYGMCISDVNAHTTCQLFELFLKLILLLIGIQSNWLLYGTFTCLSLG